MSFAHFILEEGVELEMESEIGDVIVALDTDVPGLHLSGLRVPCEA